MFVQDCRVAWAVSQDFTALLSRNKRLMDSPSFRAAKGGGFSSVWYHSGIKGYCAAPVSLGLESSTAPVTRPANAGKINANVQP